MAYMITKKELEELLERLQKNFDIMTEDQICCPICWSISPKSHGRHCWCDHISPDIDY